MLKLHTLLRRSQVVKIHQFEFTADFHLGRHRIVHWIYFVLPEHILQKAASTLLIIVENHRLIIGIDFRVIDDYEFAVFDVVGLGVCGQHSSFICFAFDLEHVVLRTIEIAY